MHGCFFSVFAEALEARSQLASRPNLRSSKELSAAFAGSPSDEAHLFESVADSCVLPTKHEASWGGDNSTAQVLGPQVLHTREGCFYRSPGIANEFFSLTHHTRWQYTSCNIPSGCRHSRRPPNAWEANENGCKEDQVQVRP